MNEDAQDNGLAFRFLVEIGIIAQLSGNGFGRLMPEGMTMPQFSVLNHFVRLGGERTPLELARAFQVTKGAMTNTLAHLHGKGEVAIRPDPVDGRSKRVSITPEGRAAHERTLETVAPEISAFLAQFPVERLAATLPLLEEVRAWLDQRRN